MVAVINIDPIGKVRFSRKVLLKEGEGTPPRYPGAGEASRSQVAATRDRLAVIATVATVVHEGIGKEIADLDVSLRIRTRRGRTTCPAFSHFLRRWVLCPRIERAQLLNVSDWG